MSINLVEWMAEEDEQESSPCAFGNVVKGHACYCHHDDGPRKCHLYWEGVDKMRACKMFKDMGCDD